MTCSFNIHIPTALSVSLAHRWRAMPRHQHVSKFLSAACLTEVDFGDLSERRVEQSSCIGGLAEIDKVDVHALPYQPNVRSILMPRTSVLS
jgi:hypothetical protein